MGKEVDKAILKVAYILSSLSGVEKAENKKVFREITKGFSWFKPGDSETDKFVLDIIETTKELATLRQLYDENDYYAAFLSRIEHECKTIKKDSKATCRKAFVIWLAICLADNDGFSEIEGKTIKVLQGYLNSNKKTIEEPVSFPPIGGVLLPPIGGILPPRSPLFPRSRFPKTRTIEVPDEYITDDFMNKALDTLTLLAELRTQIDAAFDEDQKKSLQESFDIMQKQLESLILND